MKVLSNLIKYRQMVTTSVKLEFRKCDIYRRWGFELI